jgi:hypothetical protein
MHSAKQDAMTVINNIKFNSAYQEISKYIFLFAAFVSFISLIWFGVNPTFGFWQDFTDFICALVLGVIPLRLLKNIRVVLLSVGVGILWIISKIISLYISYQRAVAHDPECNIKCVMSDPLTYASVFIIAVIIIYLYKPVTEQIKRYLRIEYN